MAEVNLIDFTGIGHSDPLYAARLLVYTKSTRLQQGAKTRMLIDTMPVDEVLKELKYMAGTIPSSWEFIHYTFEVTKHAVHTARQMQRTRTASFAEQSMRVMDKGDFTFETPPSVAADPDIARHFRHMVQKIRDLYNYAITHNIPLEDARSILPLGTHTSQIVGYNLRTLSELLGKRKSIRVQGPYREIVTAMEIEVYRVHPWAGLFLAPDYNKTPALDALIEANKDIAAAKELEKLKGTH